jgi:hypothetical protein
MARRDPHLHRGGALNLDDLTDPQHPASSTLGAAFGAASRITPYGAHLAALAGRVSAPFDVLGLGDSLLSGQSVSSIAARWPNRTMNALRARFRTPEADPGGLGYVPGFYNHGTGAPNPWAVAGNTANQATYGLGQAGKTLGADTGSGAGSVTGTFPDCTSIELAVYDATVTITLDGATVATGVGQAGRWTWNSGKLPRGSHTVVITRASGTPRFLGGLIMCNDETSGFRYFDGAKSGTRADQFSAADGGSSLWADNIGPVVSPDLILVEWMTNDYTNRTPEQYATALGNVRDLIRSRTAAPILWVAPWERVAAGFGGATWAQYVAAMETAAGADPGDSDFVNIGDYVPRLSPDTFGALADGTHPRDWFAAHVAEVLADHVLNVWARAA